jgi:CheY-like chemotaxis protein
VGPAVERARILLLEDNPGDARLVRAILEEDSEEDFEIIHVTRLADAEGRLQRGDCDAALVDLGLPDSKGLETLTTLHREFEGVPLVVLTGYDDEETRRQALSLGAADWLPKDDLDGGRLARSIDSAITRSRLSDALRAGKRHGHENEIRLLEFIVDAFEPILVLSDTRHVLFANPAAGAALGARPDRLIGRYLPLPVGHARETAATDESLEIAEGASVRSFRVHWNERPAWLVAFGTPPRRLPSSASASQSMSRARLQSAGELAAQASDVQARARFAKSATAAVGDHVEKALDLVRQWPKHRSGSETRALLVELLEGALGTARVTSAEVDRIDRASTSMIRCLGRTRRMHERSGLDALVQSACDRVRGRLPAAVRLQFRGRASGVFVEWSDEVVGLTEDLISGLADLAARHCPTGVELHLETRGRLSGCTLSVSLEPREPGREACALIVESLVAAPRHGHDALAAATRELRALEGDLSVGESIDGGVWIEVHLP